MIACEGFEEDLVLYAEGELKDAERASRIRLHLGFCGSCRAWVASYDDFTRTILETERAGATLFSDTSPDAWDAPFRRPSRGASFTDRVMASVRGLESRRRAARIRNLAAVVAVFLGLAVGGGLYLRARLEENGGPTREIAVVSPGAGSRLSSFEALPAVNDPRGRQVPVAVQPPADLKYAWWVIDPEREARRARAADVEALFFGRAEREAAASSEDRHYLMLKALLGADTFDLIDDHRGFPFVMVPEEGGREGTIPVRPIALPVEVDERELAPPALLRLKAPTRRYRLVFIGRDGFGVHLSPSAVTPPPSVPASPLYGHTPPPRIPPEFLPIAPERQ